ncbi:uncharacterized protein LOC123269064 [Cotesia glomerata]|nr:uncharacterized protein LOC123269064 [Cotesia glomerata]
MINCQMMIIATIKRKTPLFLQGSLTLPQAPQDPKPSFNIPGNSACDDKNLKTELSKSKESKKNLCFYCKKFQSQLARHLEMVYSQEELVEKFMSFDKKSLDWKNAIAVIRKKGNFDLFVNKDLNKDKYFVPTRRPADKSKCLAENYAVCPDCNGLYTKNNLRHHSKSCVMQKNGSKGVMSKSRVAVGRVHPRASEVLRQQVIPRMNEDNVVRSIRFDLAMILYGNQLCLRHRKQYRHKLIRSNLWLCGRFLIFLQEKDPEITEFASIYDPERYHFIIDCIDEFAGINKRSGHYEKAGNATEITKHIKAVGEVLKGEYIITKNDEKKSNVDNFFMLCKTGFSNVIIKTAMETHVARQREKAVELSSSTDILLLSQYLDKLIDRYYKELEEKFSYSSWRRLAEATLSRMQVFNRRRAGESERLEITDMKSVRSLKKDDEDYQDLTEEERKFADEYVRVVIRGKINQNVPVLLTKKWFKCIKLIVKYRTEAEVCPENPYVFGIRGLSDESCLSTTKLLCFFSKNCGADKPELLRGTSLRKHAATKCAQFGLDDANTAHFAKFMGHDNKIHKNIYQQPVARKDILSISKVLEKAQKPSATITSGSLNIDNELALRDSSLDRSNDISQETFESTITSNSANDMILNTLSDATEVDLSSQSLSFNQDNQDTFCKSKRRVIQPITRKTWTKDEIKSVNCHFKHYLKTQTLPPLPLIRSIQSEFGVLKNCTPKVIKAHIFNENQKAKSATNFNDEKSDKTRSNENQIKKHLKYIFQDCIEKKKNTSTRCLCNSEKN